jgi:hypothetical protein
VEMRHASVEWLVKEECRIIIMCIRYLQARGPAVWKSVVSYKMPVKDDGVTLMKDATAQFVQLITAKLR